MTFILPWKFYKISILSGIPLGRPILFVIGTSGNFMSQAEICLQLALACFFFSYGFECVILESV